MNFGSQNEASKGGYVHTQPHGHNSENHGHDATNVLTSSLDKKLGRNKMYRYLRPVIIGVIHGFTGTTALTLMIIPLIDSAWMAMLYLVIFGLGTIVGMMLITAATAVPFVYGKGEFAIFSASNLRIMAGLTSLIFGIYMAYKIGFVDGLFKLV